MTGPRSRRRRGPFFFFFLLVSSAPPIRQGYTRGVQYCNRVCIWMFLVRYINWRWQGVFFVRRAHYDRHRVRVLTPPPPAAPPIQLRSRVPPPPRIWVRYCNKPSREWFIPIGSLCLWSWFVGLLVAQVWLHSGRLGPRRRAFRQRSRHARHRGPSRPECSQTCATSTTNQLQRHGRDYQLE